MSDNTARLCGLCPHNCRIAPGGSGYCGARRNSEGRIISSAYGQVTALSLDPIEKKPLQRFHPGSMILSVGSWGCNMRCAFCQNHHISQQWQQQEIFSLSPQQLAEQAAALQDQGNIGVAFTYNEPLINYEYVRDAAALVHEKGMVNVAVTNGLLNDQPFAELLPLLDALNIDLKGWDEDYYRWLGGDLPTVLRNIEGAVQAGCHVELTTLIVPGKNDSPEQMEALSAWVAALSPDIPLHISRFFPRWQMADRPATPVQIIYQLAELARQRLRYVYTGNC